MPESALAQLINPERHLPTGHSYSRKYRRNDKRANAPTIECLAPFITDYVGKDILVAYNSKFDITLLNNAVRLNPDSGLHEKRLCLTIDPFILIQRIHPFVGAKKTLSEQYKFLFCRNLEGANGALP